MNAVPEIEVAVPARRHHDLDALRGFAMLLGIGLHAAIPFIPYWGESPANQAQGQALMLFVAFVHGFRMPLFFLLSGFFTALLWRRKGLRALVNHRLRRIALPLLVGMFTVWPAIIFAVVAAYAFNSFDETLQIKDEGNEGFSFAHMWFLWFLLWMLAGFVLVVKAAGVLKLGSSRHPRLASTMLWSLPLLTLIPQLMMTERTFGPDTSESFIPTVHVLAYYACFFAFGALVHGMRDKNDTPLIDSLGRRWPLLFGIAVVVLFGPGLALIETRWPAASLFQVAYTWTMSLAFIGLFRRCLSGERFWVRYLSDASYWMYLAHLPLVFALQGLVTPWPIPVLLKFMLICVTITAGLLIAYRYFVRYTSVGTLLNGPRSQDADRNEYVRLTEQTSAAMK